MRRLCEKKIPYILFCFSMVLFTGCDIITPSQPPATISNWNLIYMSYGAVGPYQAQIFRYDLNRKREELLADSIYGFVPFDAASDGSGIAFIRRVTPSYPPELIVAILNTISGEEIPVSVPNNYPVSLRWSNNGEYLAIVARGEDYNATLYLTDRTGTSLREIVTFAAIEQPEWSPDDTKIAFAARNEHGDTATGVVVNPDDGQWVTVTGDRIIGSGLQWSPDGTSLSFIEVTENARYLTVIDSWEKSVERLVEIARYETPLTWGFPWIPGPPSIFRWTHSWSPTGVHIVYNSYIEGEVGLYIINLVNNRIRAMRLDFHNTGLPSWSHDGTFLSFTGKPDRLTNHRLYVSSRCGSMISEVRPVETNRPAVFVPAER